jgi:ATP-dependent Clp protease ATP-binding subunit ClpC
MSEGTMFERFTERARRVIFFARLEASKTGCDAINTEHILLGLMRENMYLLPEFPPDSDLDAVRSELFGQPPSEPRPMSVDMPLTESAQRVLKQSAHERYSQKDDLVTCGHLLLGVLREEQSGACAILKRYGIQREQVMTRLPDSSQEQGPPNSDMPFDLLS